jgi:hypothetical protein
MLTCFIAIPPKDSWSKKVININNSVILDRLRKRISINGVIPINHTHIGSGIPADTFTAMLSWIY